MAQLSVDQVAYAYVAKDIDRQATTLTDPSSATYIKEGEIVVSGTNNMLVTATASSYDGVKEVKIVQRKNSGLFASPIINFKNVEFYKVTGYAPKVNKVMYVGYNGTSGSLENNVLTPSNEYEIRVTRLGLLDHYVDAYNTWKLFSYYNKTATSGQCVLARNLVKNGVDNFDNSIDGFVAIEMVTSSASAAATASVSFVQHSKLAVASAAHGITAGKFIKVNTEDTYYVESVDGLNIYLEVPYQGVSCNSTPKIVTDSNTGDWGIKLRGLDKYFDAEKNSFTYDVSDFDVSLVGFNDTQKTYSVSASLGNGTWQEVAQLEWEVQDYEGQTSHTDWQSPSRKRYFEEGKTYDMLVIKGFDNSVTQVSGTPISPFTILVAIPVGNTQGDSAGSATMGMGVATALDAWLTTNTGTTYDETANLS